MEKATEHNIQWKKVKLGEVGEIVSGGTPSTSNEAFWDGGVLFVTPLDLGRKKEISSTIRTISELGVNNSSANKIKKNSLAISTRAPIGLMSIVNQEFTTNQGCKSIQFFDNYDCQFFYYYLLYNVEQIRRHGQGTTFMEISKTDFANVEISVPSLPAQRRIAAILSVADKVIEQTRQLIGKYKSIKQGVMEDLLKPKEGWKKVKLGEVGTFKNGINKDKSQFGFGTLYVSISDAYYENIDFKKLNRLNATEKEIEEYLLVDDDIVFVRSSVKPSGVGYTTLFRHYEKEPVLFSGFMIRYRLNDKVNNSAEFLNYLFRSEEFRRQVIGKSTVSANTNVNQESLKELVCFIPDFPEQRRIAKILSGIDRKIEAEEKVLEKYEKMKKGLMERLLVMK